MNSLLKGYGAMLVVGIGLWLIWLVCKKDDDCFICVLLFILGVAMGFVIGRVTL